MLALAALTLSLQVTQTSFDLLDGVSIEVAAHNGTSTPQIVKFARPAEYEIQVLRGDSVIWSNATAVPTGVTFPIHMRAFVPGPSVLVVYIWNALESDGSSPGPGEYSVRARLLGMGVTPEARANVRFIAPLPTASLEKLKLGDTVTIAGTLDARKNVLTDASGSVMLARRLLTAPASAVAVRGYLIRRPDRSHVFFVQRWAPIE
jgi:hypothetical protein